MAAFTKTTVDGNTNTARLDIFVDGILVTTYSYAADVFTLSERATDVVITKDDLSSNVADINAWMMLVGNHCVVVYEDFAPHELNLDDKSNRFIFRLKYGDVMAIHAIVQKTTPEIEFKARPELNLTPEEFRRFRKVLGAINAYNGPYFFFNGEG
jgi:hypothetical protein